MAVLVLSVLVACGDDSPIEDVAATLPPTASTPAPSSSPSTAPGDSYAVAGGPDDVVISVSQEGGFVPAELMFSRTPDALITADGRSLTTGPVIAIYPGPLLPNVLERSITPVATQQLLAKADELGLLADVTYTRNDRIADATDTVVTITVGGETYRHQAYALGLDTEDDPARARLAEFVDAMRDLPATVGDSELGPEQPFAAEQYLIQATPVERGSIATDVEPAYVPWPADAPVELANAATCASVPAAFAEPLFVDATTLTFFTEGDVTYQLAVVPQVPGRSC